MKEVIDIFNAYMKLGEDFIVLHGGGKVRWLNKHGLNLLGYELTEVIGRPCLDFIHPDCREVIKKRIYHRYNRENKALPRIETQLLKKNGDFVWVEVGSGPVLLEEYRLVIVVGRDISARKETEELLIETVMALLPGRLSELLRLLVQGKEYDEIMQVMDLDIENVKRYHRRLNEHLVKNFSERSLEKILRLLK